MPKPFSTDLRERALALVEEGRTEAEIAELLQIARSTVTRWKGRQRACGQVAPMTMGGWRHGLTDADVALVAKLVAEKPDQTLPELADAFHARTGRKTSRSAISRALTKLGITRKKKSFRAAERKSPQVQKKRRLWRRRQKRLKAARLVFVDESGTHLAMSRPYGRAPRGERVEEHVPRQRGTITTFIGALTVKGVKAPMTISGGTSGDVFVAYLEQVLIPTLKPGDTVVLDNLGAHHDDRVAPLLRKSGVSVLYLPPYSPEFDPLEEGLSTIKWFLKSAKARTLRALQRAIAAAIEKITPKDAIGWFHHAGYLAST